MFSPVKFLIPSQLSDNSKQKLTGPIKRISKQEFPHVLKAFSQKLEGGMAAVIR
jgi:hypothetical protein